MVAVSTSARGATKSLSRLKGRRHGFQSLRGSDGSPAGRPARDRRAASVPTAAPVIINGLHRQTILTMKPLPGTLV